MPHPHANRRRPPACRGTATPQGQSSGTGWIPDWFGPNGRTVIDPLFRTNCLVNTHNYGCLNDTKLDHLIAQAETATSPSAAAAIWHQADIQVMKDAAIVPLCDDQAPFYTSKRVQNSGSPAVIYAPNIGGLDITNVWLNPNSP